MDSSVRSLLESVTTPTRMRREEVQAVLESDDLVVDFRSQDDYASIHLPGESPGIFLALDLCFAAFNDIASVVADDRCHLGLEADGDLTLFGDRVERRIGERHVADPDELRIDGQALTLAFIDDAGKGFIHVFRDIGHDDSGDGGSEYP